MSRTRIMSVESPQFSRRKLIQSGLTGLAGGSRVIRSFGSAPALEQPSDATTRAPHFPARAKSVIFLFMLGGPSQLDLFDDKPKLREMDGQPIGDELLSKMKFAQIMEQRPGLLGSHVTFKRYGQSGAEVSELLPHTARIVDDLAIIKTIRFQNTANERAWLETTQPNVRLHADVGHAGGGG